MDKWEKLQNIFYNSAIFLSKNEEKGQYDNQIIVKGLEILTNDFNDWKQRYEKEN